MDAPDTIWLQWHGDADADIETGAVDEDAVTWYRNKINDSDIEYVRKACEQAEQGHIYRAALEMIADPVYRSYAEVEEQGAFLAATARRALKDAARLRGDGEACEQPHASVTEAAVAAAATWKPVSLAMAEKWARAGQPFPVGEKFEQEYQEAMVTHILGHFAGFMKAEEPSATLREQAQTVADALRPYVSRGTGVPGGWTDIVADALAHVRPDEKNSITDDELRDAYQAVQEENEKLREFTLTQVTERCFDDHAHYHTSCESCGARKVLYGLHDDGTHSTPPALDKGDIR